MSPPDIARRRLRASRLTGPAVTSPPEAVGWHLAMQAQDYAPAKWSIGQRSTGLRDEDLDRALTEGSIVRTHVLRPTWHLVAREDLRWLLALSGPRVQRGNARRYGELGLDARTLARGERVIVRALEAGARLTRRELAEILDRSGFDREGQRMPYLLMHLELEAVIGSGGPAGKQQTYALLEGRVPTDPGLDREAAIVELVRRYLQSHGPATVKDLRWWSGLTMSDLRTALADLAEDTGTETVDGFQLWSLTSQAARPPAGGVELLPTYDELGVGYTESRFLGDPLMERARAAWGDRSLPSGIVIVDGGIAGHWRRTVEGKAIRVEAHLYEPRRRGLAARVEAAADELGAFFGRPIAFSVSAA